ncbi:MAG: GNAT family N-acetyltransferase [Armatimonadota bacterium]
MSTFLVSRATTEDLPQVEALYRDCGYRGGASAADIVLVAWEKERLVGAVRLCREEGVTMLRGMMVLPERQGRGIGKHLLQACAQQLDNMDAQCWCIPYAHLRDFYAGIGFQIVTLDQVPDGRLRERYQNYQSEGREVLLMVREAGSA